MSQAARTSVLDGAWFAARARSGGNAASAIVRQASAAIAPTKKIAEALVKNARTAAAPASTVAGCDSYASWYDAQVAYEAAGMTAADQAVVAALDPDYDGIACEEGM